MITVVALKQNLSRKEFHIHCFAGTHGSGVTYTNLAAMVTKLELITGEGKVLTLAQKINQDIFKAAQVHTLRKICIHCFKVLECCDMCAFVALACMHSACI